MKTLNIKFEMGYNLTYIPAEIILCIGELSATTTLKIFRDNSESGSFINYCLDNLINYYSINNIQFSQDFENYHIYKLSSSNLYFSKTLDRKNLVNSMGLNKFIMEYEKIYGTLPFYTVKNKNIEKYLYINDIILKLSNDIISH